MPEANCQSPSSSGQVSQVAPSAIDASCHEAEILSGTPYRVLRKIGAGGMGAVFEAEHQALGKRVVVKLLRAEYASDPRLVARLKREARILARIASPHVVMVSDLGQTARGWPYIAMERLDGNTLGHELKTRGALPISEALQWTREILAGLSAAHRTGVVHRDIKLENIFLCEATEHAPRRIKLLDFGIAKILKDATAGMDLSRHQPTAEGTLLGSPRWLAPEQAMGKAVDGRADIYAVGLVVYSLVAGRGPFAHIRDAIDAIQASIREQPPPPSKYAPQEIPAALDDAIMMALSKDPAHRFQTAEAFAVALDSIAREVQDATQPLPAKYVWRRTDVDARTNRPEPEIVRDHTQPTILRRPADEPASERHVDSDLAEEPDVAPDDLEGKPSIGVFFALTAASTLFFSAVMALVLYFAGGR